MQNLTTYLPFISGLGLSVVVHGAIISAVVGGFDRGSDQEPPPLVAIANSVVFVDASAPQTDQPIEVIESAAQPLRKVRVAESSPRKANDCGRATCDNPSTLPTLADAPLGLITLHTPKPPYPYAARRAGFEGKVGLRVVVDHSGQVKTAEVVQSSGRSDCDEAALKTVLTKWRFNPLGPDKAAVERREHVAVVFRLR